MIAGLSENVNVLGAAPVLDRKSPSVTISFDAAQLANLPGTRSMGAILSATPAVHLARFDIGGSAGLISPVFSAYDTGGRAYPMLEGIFIGRINPYGLTLDYGSFQEVSVTSAAFGHDNQLRAAGAVRHEVRRQSVSRFVLRRLRRSALAGVQHRPDADRARGCSRRLPVARRQSLVELSRPQRRRGRLHQEEPLWWYASSRRQAVSGRLVASRSSRIAPRSGTSPSRAPSLEDRQR